MIRDIRGIRGSSPGETHRCCYGFPSDGNYLTFPWTQGTRVEEMEAHYETASPEFSDWTHAISNTPMLKMRHPDYEVYLTGIHAYRDVSCADCHMPYRTEGGVKFTDHCVRSPLGNIANSCAVCHRWSEDEPRGRVEAIQDKVAEGRRPADLTIVTTGGTRNPPWRPGGLLPVSRSASPHAIYWGFRCGSRRVPGRSLWPASSKGP
jgi:formate-dependent nitrite reductase cytochrome c552 subunit